MEINKENCKSFGNGEKYWSCGLLPYNFSIQETKQTNKQTNKIIY